MAKALDEIGETINIVQFDAHLDFAMSRGPQKYGNGSPIRRMREMPHIGSIVQIGMRGLGSSSRQDWEEARAANTVITAKDFHRLGVEKVLAQIPAGKTFITFDIDAYDISLMPATAAPSPGGLLYDETCELLSGICAKRTSIGFDWWKPRVLRHSRHYRLPPGCTDHAAYHGQMTKKHWRNSPSLIIMVQNEYIIYKIGGNAYASFQLLSSTAP